MFNNILEPRYIQSMYADRTGLVTISTTCMLQNVLPFSFSIDLLLIIDLWETGSQVCYCHINVLSKLEQSNTKLTTPVLETITILQSNILQT